MRMFFSKYHNMIILLSSCMIFGCDNYDNMKESLQSKNDELNPTGNRAFCYYIGNVQFPYINESIKNNDIDWVVNNKKNLSVRLPAFVNSGLLISNKISGNEDANYEYHLTDKGKDYLYIYNRNLKTRIKNENYFCFGRVVIQSVESVKKVDHGNNITPPETLVTFTYTVENIPEWALSPALFEPYNTKGPLFNNGIGPYKKKISLVKINGEIVGMSAGEKIGYFL
ncbi:hypothetical protein I2494_00445 [Budviciaceae bacterium BWR-B9]|uniref:Uncharacterized protein n=1 Tax=Limnobaculum allomyrinae TaxID=2791986 RepID=A0ABS1IKC6_9GAMM|nr:MULTISPECIES: hypothetical protein [Limnobaculum]MBK5142200.1 hypothetical protein [Limnobaculum allomyrinae]MBV7690916.1 hypothetical protein [Limnobaculum sp. M2-1]